MHFCVCKSHKTFQTPRAPIEEEIGNRVEEKRTKKRRKITEVKNGHWIIFFWKGGWKGNEVHSGCEWMQHRTADCMCGHTEVKRMEHTVANGQTYSERTFTGAYIIHSLENMECVQ